MQKTHSNYTILTTTTAKLNVRIEQFRLNSSYPLLASPKGYTVSFQEIFETQKKYSWILRQESISSRKKILRHLLQVVLKAEQQICAAHQKDFNKPAFETLLTEIYPVVKELRLILRQLSQWSRPESVASGALLFGSRCEIRQEPKGTVLIIAPWNYPFSLSLVPLVSAIAAGNTVILKPSELTIHVSSLIEKIINEVFPKKLVEVILGGAEVSQKLLDLPFDHIFFTGSTAVGKIVMEKGAKNLSSVTLELGGKSPALIHSSCDLDLTASKILWGKFINGGQTCVAPDYAFVDESICEVLISKMQHKIQQHYGQTTSSASIISEKHFLRLKNLLIEAFRNGTQVYSMAKKISDEEDLLSLFSKSSLHFPPFLVLNPKDNSKLMQEEIFGPILPIYSCRDMDQAIQFIQSRPKPLALYIFSRNTEWTESVLQQTSSGGVCMNDTLLHLGNHNLPFGGVGESGTGNYHGLHGFKTFSHQRAVLKQGVFARAITYFYPPYNPLKYKLFRLLVRLGF